ncbi:hypothetical protein LEP1GSC100_1542 [Leptospira interrogans serovar Bataviae str. UI 08561]|nr:hypothetical protein LEP1GSC100_1542 [Leptospira interrogans serovar Bataviae str. UI 08561]
MWGWYRFAEYFSHRFFSSHTKFTLKLSSLKEKPEFLPVWVLFPFKKIPDTDPDFRKISSDYNHTQAAKSPFCNQNVFRKTS